MKEHVTGIFLKALSDVYRFTAAFVDWRCHVRRLAGRPQYDIACVTNFEDRLQQNFMGFLSERRPFKYGMRFSIGGAVGRYLLINSSAIDIERGQTRDLAKTQARIAVVTAIRHRAKVILFAAATKRLFSDEELKSLSADYPEVTFTIGDNGTAWALISDVFDAIHCCGLSRHARIVVLGPNGYLGSAITQALADAGFSDLTPIGNADAGTIGQVRDIDLLVACSHHRYLRLKAPIVRQMAGKSGMHVVDVCKPPNLSKREYLECQDVCSRQDSGMVLNRRIRYVFSIGALPILSKLNIGLNRLYGCFAEASALALSDAIAVSDADFLKVSPDTIALVGRIFKNEGFRPLPPVNFGEPLDLRVSHKESVPSNQAL